MFQFEFIDSSHQGVTQQNCPVFARGSSQMTCDALDAEYVSDDASWDNATVDFDSNAPAGQFSSKPWSPSTAVVTDAIAVTARVPLVSSVAMSQQPNGLLSITARFWDSAHPLAPRGLKELMIA